MWALRSRPAALSRTLSFMIAGPTGCAPTCEQTIDAGDVVPARVDIMIVTDPTQWVTQWRSGRPVAWRIVRPAGGGSKGATSSAVNESKQGGRSDEPRHSWI